MIQARPLILNILFLFLYCFAFSQETKEIRDFSTKESIPFVKIYPKDGPAFLADLNGQFVWKAEWESVKLVYSGYFDTTYLSNQAGEKVLYLAPKVQNIQEITVVPGENPAHRIIDLVIANRKKNNPLENDGFQYFSYTKFHATIDEELFKQNPDYVKDTNMVKLKGFVDSSHLFMIETSSYRMFSPPVNDKEEVIAYKVSGLQDPMFATISRELQSFSFYENQFSLGGKTYINPIAFGGTRRYLFQITDTTYSGKDTVFHISYRPRLGKNFDGLKGALYINSNGYALERVISEPAENTEQTGGIKILQEYQFIDNKKWFPVKLSSELTLKMATAKVGDSVLRIICKSNTYIDSVQLNPENLRRKFFDNALVRVADGADQVSDSTWNKLRKDELTFRENNTYQVIDSIAEESKLEKRLNTLKVLSTGKIPLNYVNADIGKVLGFNLHEGFRLGLRLETSEKVSKRLTLGGYVAYGYRDLRTKWGGDLKFLLFPPKSFAIKISYVDDVMERGGRPYLTENAGFKSSNYLRKIYISNMDRHREAAAETFIYLRSNLRLGIHSSYDRITFLQNYSWDRQGTNSIEKLASREVFLIGGSVLYSIREKVIYLGNQRISQGSNYPSIYVHASKGLSSVFESEADFTRLMVEINHSFPVRGVGKLKYVLTGGAFNGEAPLNYSFGIYNSFSIQNKLNLSVANTFETVENHNYYFREHISFFTRFDFNKWKINKEFQPFLSLHHGIGWGNAVAFISENYLHKGNISGMEKGYFESGVLFNNILNGIGIGVFHRYGAYAVPNELKNLFVKLSLSVAF